MIQNSDPPHRSPARTGSYLQHHLWIDMLVIGILILLNSLIMMNSSAVIDTARDIYFAWQIAIGVGFPLEGPQLAGALHSGPIWFYVLAMPLLFTKSWSVIAVWVGLLSSLKFYLAYACGNRLGERNFGLIWACLLAFPDWNSTTYLIFSHINLIETTVMLSFYCFIRWQQGEKNWFLAICLSIGIGLHAHPTVYATGFVFFPFVLLSLARKEISLKYVIGGALLVLLPFLPYLVSQHLHQWPDLKTTQSYFESQSALNNLAGFFDVLRGTVFDGPVNTLRYILGLQGWLFKLTFSIIALIWAGGFLLTAVQIPRDGDNKFPLLLLAASLIITAGVALIRDFTTFYMTLVIYPPIYGLIAWGWSRFPIRPGWLASTTFPLMSAIFLAGFYSSTLEMSKSGYAEVDGKTLNNVRNRLTGMTDDSNYFPAWARQQFGVFICAQKQPVFFHGAASMILEQSYALEARMHCDTSSIYLGGKGQGQHFIGITNRHFEQMGILPDKAFIGPLGIQVVKQVIAPNHKELIPVGDVYPPRQFFYTGSSDYEVEFSSSGSEILAITNLYHYWMPYSYTVIMNGQDIEPLHTYTLTSYFSCKHCPPEDIVNWHVTITAPRPELVDIVTFVPDTPAQ